jgi:type IV pilus assembly protein PilO
MKHLPINLADINWDLNEAWRWPMPIQLTVIIVSSFLFALICFNYDTQNELSELDTLKKSEIQLKTTFEAKQKLTGNVLNQQAQLNIIESQWQEMAVNMPIDENASPLLQRISQMGIYDHLELKSLQLMPNVPQDIFVELPIHIEVTGKYNELYTFISELEQLIPLVTLHDFTISSQDSLQGRQSNNRLLMSLFINAYLPSEKIKKNVAQ